MQETIAGAGIPMYIVLDSDAASLAPWILQPGSVTSLLFRVVLIRVARDLAFDRFPMTTTEARSVGHRNAESINACAANI